MTSLILEITSAVFDQLGYALVGMVLAFVALLLATAELLIHMARKGRMSLLPISLRPSTRTLATGKPVGTIVQYFGFGTPDDPFFPSLKEFCFCDPLDFCYLGWSDLSWWRVLLEIKTIYEDVSHYASKAPHPKMARPWLQVAMVAAGDDAKAKLVHSRWTYGTLPYASCQFTAPK
ncbi:hypothetical protein OIU84_027804 [Salix udensis]|uniref:Uncharacterized protein n=1 Tax=Salix udensis TaxID=889485 RepID=A0AAD6KHP5_9ROSI|nr:hypothetical protein OIU84_027804 [Salix udensis]